MSLIVHHTTNMNAIPGYGQMLHYFVSNIQSLLIYTGEIKQILENELQIPVSKMLLKGWKTGDVEDSVSFLIA